MKVNDADIGPLTHKYSSGFFLHPNLVVDATDRRVIGLSDIYLWNRAFDGATKHERQYRYLPLEAKESYRWIHCGQQSSHRLKAAEKITLVADREADIYEMFTHLPSEQLALLIRCSENRRVAGQPDRLFEQLATFPKAGELPITIGPGSARSPRVARLQLSWGKVALQRPTKYNKSSTLPERVDVYALLVEESADSVPEGEEPICWRLLTTHPVTTLAMARAVVGWYSWRWFIEQLFRLLKQQGLQLQACQLSRGKALKKLTVMSVETAVKVMQLVQSRHGKPQVMAEQFFSQDELACMQALLPSLQANTGKQQNPHPPYSLAWAAWVVARLGGWKGLASQAPAGPITMKRGLERFEQVLLGWKLANQKGPT